MSKENFEESVVILKILSNPMRLKLFIELYKHKTLNVTQLTKILKLPQSTVSQHLANMRGKVLTGDRKGLEVYYSIHNQKAKEIIRILF